MNCYITSLIISFVLILIYFILRRIRKPKCMRVTVLVLGDIGRSPRMEFHSIELAKICPVSIVCYEETQPLSSITENQNIVRYPLHILPPLKSIPLRTIVWILFYAPLKFFYLAIQLLYLLLFKLPNYSHILIQNPPSLPSFIIAAFVKFITGCTVIVDWHNTAYSIVMNVHHLKETNPLIVMLKHYELLLPLYFDYHFTVTKAMKEFLVQHNFKHEKITVLYDKPFININSTQSQKVELFSRLKSTFPTYSIPFIDSLIQDDEKIVCGVSSTSWTPDEDFGVLFDALLSYEKSELNLPKLIVFITGKGPLREFYEKRIEEEKMKRVCVIPIWLSHEDYPYLLSSCDFGVSLHQSSSQLDLPMKVLDMFGCSLPVLARGYQCLKDELVVEGIYGYCFDTSEQLAELMINILSDDKKSAMFFVSMKQHVIENTKVTWSQNWKNVVRPLFLAEQEKKIQ
ncbi:chitobiosyldiphosphodolichol beta-mannosyltransferase [Entamoeba histolytica HM-3:IMSS]|nr:chitobiosyldiphosphodolichol beta-mannosyltransferase [Entamoeba histolytica HM-3:IMSS]GAT96422.1 chitobiosyldiphosphodolichol beta-mannosyltransfera [Entamoeba histolytica]